MASFCTRCGSEIVAAADGFCGKCGSARFKSTVQVKKKIPLAGKIVLGVLGGFLILGLIGALTSNSNQPNAPAPPRAAASDNSQPAYVDGVKPILSRMGDSMAEFNALIQTPRPDDVNWRADVDAQFQVWRNARAELAKLPPPARLAEANATLLKGMGYLSSAADDTDNAMDNDNLPLLQHAKDEIAAAIQQFAFANQKVAALAQP